MPADTIKPPAPTTENIYGAAIESMFIGEAHAIEIDKAHRHRVLTYIRNKYGDDRRYTTKTLFEKMRLYRLK